MNNTQETDSRIDHFRKYLGLRRVRCYGRIDWIDLELELDFPWEDILNGDEVAYTRLRSILEDKVREYYPKNKSYLSRKSGGHIEALRKTVRKFNLEYNSDL